MQTDDQSNSSPRVHAARAAVWMLILGGTLVFWGAVGWWLLQFVR